MALLDATHPSNSIDNFQPLPSGESIEQFEDFEDPESEGVLTLRPSALSALTAFLDEQQAAREAMVSLAVESHSQSLVALRFPTDDHPGDNDVRQKGSLMINSSHFSLEVGKFKNVFKENWQLSQFWYSQDTAERLTQAIKGACPIGARVAFVCCPTGYVAFKKTALPTQDIFLLEYDTRFSAIAGAAFVHYDLNEPLSFAGAEALRHSLDVVIVDPPFHSEASQNNVALTLAHILRPGGRLVLLTGLILSSLIDTIYSSPLLPKLQRRDFVLEHDGMGRLETPYGCWVGGGTEFEDESGFGEVLECGHHV